jgi:hypothetical protein
MQGRKDNGQAERRKGKPLTRVVSRTLPIRGKSLTPESRVATLDARISLLEDRDETHKLSGSGLDIMYGNSEE